MTPWDEIYEDVDGAPRVKLAADRKTELIGFRVEGIIYAPDYESARRRAHSANLWFEHARVLDDYDGVPVHGGVSDPAETSEGELSALRVEASLGSAGAISRLAEMGQPPVTIWEGDDLRWESQNHEEEPRDQESDQHIFQHGYWSLGPEHGGTWSLTLIEQDENLDIMHEWTWRAATEQRVKDIASYIEQGVRELRRVSPDANVHEWITSTLWLPV